MDLRSMLFAAGSGLLLAVTFPTIQLHLLAWVALVPLFHALRGQTVKKGFWLGAVTGLIYFTGTVHWVTNSVHYYGNIPLIPASLITLLLCAYLALYPALFAAAVVYVRERRPAVLFLAVPCLWTALELARTYVFSGFPWALLGYSQYSTLPVIQIADITGVYGVSFLIVLVNTALYGIISDKTKFIGLVSAAVTVLLVLSYGFVRLNTSRDAGGIAISVVQGNIEQDKKWDSAYQAETIGVYKTLTREAIKQEPDLVIWPETSVPFYFLADTKTDRKLSEELREFVRSIRVPLLFGSATYEIKKPKEFILRNSAFLLAPDGTTSARYDKFHLVPFGEYVPLKRILFFVEKMVQSVGDFASGTDYTIMTVGGRSPETTKVSTVICYEIIFPDLVRKFVDKGAGILTTITNDAWFGRSAAPYQHFSMAVFRAVENRVPVARAANTGISGFIDANGRILAASDIFTQAFLTQRLVPGETRTIYTKFGDIFSYLSVLASGYLLLLSSRRKS